MVASWSNRGFTLRFLEYANNDPAGVLISCSNVCVFANPEVVLEVVDAVFPIVDDEVVDAVFPIVDDEVVDAVLLPIEDDTDAVLLPNDIYTIHSVIFLVCNSVSRLCVIDGSILLPVRISLRCSSNPVGIFVHSS